MKKNIYIAIAVAAVAVGCTKSNLVDAPEAQQTPISFETYTGKTPTTKAVSETTETLAATYNDENKTAIHVNAFVPGTYTGAYTSMDVWCESYTPDNVQTNETNEFSATWKYSGQAYWPSNGKLDFIAYGNNAADHLVSIDGSLTSFNYTVPTKASEQEDLIVAVTPTAGSMPTNGRVSLAFKHLLSRVGFTLKTTQAHEGVSVTINSVVLKGSNFASTGTLDFLNAGALVTEPSIAAVVDAEVTSYSLFDTSYPAASYDYFFTADSPGPDNGIGIYANKRYAEGSNVDTSVSENDRYMMLIPGASIAGAEVYYKLPGAEEQHAIATLTSPITLEKGKAYEFIIKISTDAIEFSGEVTDWDPANGTDTPVPQPEPTPEP